MIAAFRAELIRHSRPKLLALLASLFVGFGVLGAVLTFATAVHSTHDLAGQEKFITTLAALAQPSGASHGFIASTSLIGIVVGVLAAATIGTDYALGTLRPLLVRHPQRASLLAGKLLAFAALIAIGLALTQIVANTVSLFYAHEIGVSTAHWFSAAGLRAVGDAYLKAVFICLAWQAFGTAAAVLTRSVTIAVVAVVVWAVPIERILGSALASAPHWLPGLMLEALSVGDTHTATTTRVLTLVTCYAILLLALAFLDFQRRDITA
jgi:ABC-type transport system involved in multi-copper enzyme maturation permease subunit